MGDAGGDGAARQHQHQLRGTIPSMDALVAARSGGGGGAAGGGRASASAAAALPPPPPQPSALPLATGVFADEEAAAAAAPGPPSAAPPPPPPPHTYPLPFHRPGPASTPHAPPPATPSLTTLFATHPGSLIVSRRQAGNPLLPHLPPGRWAWGPADSPADYYPAPDIHALFLSLRYHLLKPDYIVARIRALTGPPAAAAGVPPGSLPPPPRLRLLICQVDVDDLAPPLEGVNVLALRAGLTLVCATTAAAAARWLDLYRALAGAPPTAIAGRAETSAPAILGAALTGIRGVNATDVLTLGANFRTAAGIFSAPPSALAAVPGIGPTKARRLADAFHTPFRRPLRQTRLDAVFGNSGEGAGAAPPAAAPAAAPPPPPPRLPEAEVVVVGDDGDDDAAAPPPPPAEGTAAVPADAGWAAAAAAALDEFVYDDFDDTEVLEGGGGGEED